MSKEYDVFDTFFVVMIMMMMMNWWQRAFADLNIISWEESEASMGFSNPPAFVNLKRSPCWDEGRGQKGHEEEESMTRVGPKEG